MSDILGGTPPEPAGDRPQNTRNASHTHHYWNANERRWTTETCYCDTGADHTTPRE